MPPEVRARRRLEVTEVSPSCTYLRGPGVREAVIEVAGRPPVFAVRARAWVCQPSTSADVVALCESRGYEVIITALDTSSTAAMDISLRVPTDSAGGLW